MERAKIVESWFNQGGVLIIGYDLFRNLISADYPSQTEEQVFTKCLGNPGPDLVVCDEGHLLKNDKTALSDAFSSIRTMRRIVLTGTPLQNNLKEYYCMISFVKPYLLGTRKEFFNRFVNPISNGQYENSYNSDIKMMQQRSHILHDVLDGCVQRLDSSILQPMLAEKHEYVLYVRLGTLQVNLYQV